ncbi:MAG: hypothetical protein WC223_10725 [Bacteroidales bacterium]|jgi:energy-coupling factor transporter ATP-binding protein EcfA2
MKSDISDLRKLIGNIPVKRVKFDEEETLHEILINKGKEAVAEKLTHTINCEEEADDNPLPEKQKEENKNDIENKTQPQSQPLIIEKQEELQSVEEAEIIETSFQTTEEIKPEIQTIYDGKLLLQNKLNNYFVLGAISQDLSVLPVTLIIEEKATGRKERVKIDLYERESIRYLAEQIANIYYQNNEQIETELLQLTDLLEKYRENQIEQYRNELKIRRNYQQVPPEKEKQIIQFLKEPNLIENIDKLIEKAGVVGEENTRKLLFVNASTYKMSNPLHTLIQGTSGSGKSHLINTIGQCFPSEDVLIMTRVTSKSFYHYSKEELVDKLLLLQDYDGLDEEAQYAFRELQSSGVLSSSTTYKDRNGNITSVVKIVKSNFASLLATTHAEIYYDSMSRSVVIGVDESEEQTQKIIEHQNNVLSGIIDQAEERKAKVFLQNCIRLIKPYEVINPYASKVKLPTEAKMLRRLNFHYQQFVKQITILHQYQRNKDNKGRLIAEPEDLRIAFNILFDAIILKVDDLDSSLRQFFDKLKDYVKQQSQNKANEYQFTQREIRLTLNLSRGTCFRYMESLEMLEYIQKVGGYSNKGFKYKIVFFDDIQKIKTKIKDELNKQLETINNANSSQ